MVEENENHDLESEPAGEPEPEVSEPTSREPEARGPVAQAQRGKPGAEGPPKKWDRGLIVVFIIIAAYCALFITLTLLRYANFRASNLDTAIFSQVIWLMSRFKAPFSTIRGTNLYGDHFAPILVLLVPLYWIKGNVPALLTVQTIVISLGALPLYLLARDKLSSRPVAVAVSAAFLIYPATQFLNLFDFHPEAIGLTCLLFAFLAIDRKKFGWFYATCFLAAMCKEDMVLAVLVLGILVYFLYDKRAGKIVAFSSLLYFVVVVLFLLPAFAPAGYQYSSRLGQFGKSPTEALKNMIIHPRHTIEVLATRTNLRYILDLLLPVAFLAAFAPVYLLPALPAFAINIISDFGPQHTIGFQYTAAIIPFVFIAAIFGLRRIKKWLEGGFRAKLALGAVAWIMLLCVLGANIYYGPSPVSGGWRSSAYTSDAHIDAIRKGLALIPNNASVSAQVFLLDHLSEREKLYMFPEPYVDLVDLRYFNSIGDGVKTVFPNTYKRHLKGKDHRLTPVPGVKYVALDRSTSVLPLPEDALQYKKLILRLMANGYKPIYAKSGVLILEKSSSP